MKTILEHEEIISLKLGGNTGVKSQVPRAKDFTLYKDFCVLFCRANAALALQKYRRFPVQSSYLGVS